MSSYSVSLDVVLGLQPNLGLQTPQLFLKQFLNGHTAEIFNQSWKT